MVEIGCEKQISEYFYHDSFLDSTFAQKDDITSFFLGYCHFEFIEPW